MSEVTREDLEEIHRDLEKLSKTQLGSTRFIDLLTKLSALATPGVLLLVAWLQLAEDGRARDRWESAAFQRRIEAVVDNRTRDLATKQDLGYISQDLSRLEASIGQLSNELKPITEHLIRSGVMQ